MVTDEMDNVIDLVKERLKRGVSKERLLSNAEIDLACKALVYLREDNVELLKHILNNGKAKDETLDL